MAKSIASLLYFLSLTSAAKTQWIVGQTVKTTSGIVKGHAATLPGTQEVSEYLGIRFGQGTSGENRFVRPKPFTSSATIEASNYGPGCPALAMPIPSGAPGIGRGSPGGPPPISGGTQSEDCLFLNVWGKPQVGEKKKAVMAWIFGGGFSVGDASTPMYDGANLAQNQDVIVVTFNYRTNIFGFPGAPNIPDSNLAFLDQRLAIEWVRDNIEEFGGDPKRITIFGESAGSSSVDYFSYAWLSNPIVNAFIEQSGTAMMTGPFAPVGPEQRAEAWFNTSSKLGCGGKEAGSATTIKCAQQKTVKEIQDAMPKASGFEAVVGFFGPNYDNKTVFKDIHNIAKAGKLIHKPLLSGSNHNESTMFTMMGGASSEVDIALNNGFRCGTAEAAKARVLHHIPVWRYHYAATHPGSTLGAFHGQDIQLVFNGTSGLSKVMQTAWGTFAKDPVNGLTKLGWPKYDPDGKTLVRLGYNDAVEPEFVESTLYDGQCPPSPI